MSHKGSRMEGANSAGLYSGVDDKDKDGLGPLALGDIQRWLRTWRLWGERKET